MSRLQKAGIASVKTALGWVPAQWLPGGTPDPLIQRRVAIGRQDSRLDGPVKVGGQARFAAEVAMDRLSYATLVHSTVTHGRIPRLDPAAPEAAPGGLPVMTQDRKSGG